MTARSIKLRWSDLHSLPLTESVIRSLHGAPALSRVSRVYRLGPGEEIVGRARPGRLYVLSGRCVVRDHDELELEQGDVLEFAGGGYAVEGSGDDGAVVIWAWELPEPFRSPVEPGRH